MHLILTFKKNFIAYIGLLLAVLLCGCTKPEPDAAKGSSAKPAAQAPASPNTSPNSTAASVASAVAETKDADVASSVVHILNAAHRNGAVILHGECGPNGITDPYVLQPPVKLEPINDALQDISARYQNLYWRESRESGVRVIDSGVKATLLKVRLREFRIVEDREPDAALAALWRAPEVAAFLRRNNVRMPRKTSTTKKAISPPMIIEMKNAIVADILDRIAAGYRADPPKVWTYRECVDDKDKKKKEILIDVQIR